MATVIKYIAKVGLIGMLIAAHAVAMGLILGVNSTLSLGDKWGVCLAMACIDCFFMLGCAAIQE